MTGSEIDTRIVAIYATFPDMATAERVSRKLIEERVLACANLLPGVNFNLSLVRCRRAGDRGRTHRQDGCKARR